MQRYGGSQEIVEREMLQQMSGSRLRDVARREHSAALEGYCAALASISKTLHGGLEPTSEQLELAQAAKLRLENARTLLQLSVDLAASGAVQEPRRRRRIH
jgi:hypothetical protein